MQILFHIILVAHFEYYWIHRFYLLLRWRCRHPRSVAKPKLELVKIKCVCVFFYLTSVKKTSKGKFVTRACSVKSLWLQSFLPPKNVYLRFD